ncbi:MAG: hypothetical protein R2780_03225 [Crocinitomicaceae bacterium]
MSNFENKFYIIKPAVDTEETGHVYPAVQSAPDYNFNTENSIHRLNHHEFPDFEPNFTFHLSEGARVCDLMGQATISASGLLISERLKNLLVEFNIAPHKLFPINIVGNGTSYNYYWLHIVWKEIEDLIDYNQSKFFKKRGPRNLGELKIKSRDDYWHQKKELGSRFLIGFEKIKFLRVPNFDVWVMPFRGDIICNEEVAMLIRQNTDFKGIQISPSTQFEF